MKLKALEALIRVVDAGSVRAGARSLKVSQPTVTAALHQLEEELGAQLLVRTKRGVQPTSYGQVLIQRARTIAAEARRAREEIAQLRGDWHGAVTFAVSPAIGLEVIPDVVRAYTRRFPTVKLHCSEGIFPEVAPSVRAGLLDFAVGPGPSPKDTVHGSLYIEPLLTADVVIAGAGSHPASNAKSIRELRDCNWVLSGALTDRGAIIVDTFASYGLPSPRIGMVCTSFLMVPAIVAATGMLATMPRAVLNSAARRYDLVEVQIREKLAPRTIVVMRSAESPPTPAASALIDAIRRAARRGKTALRAG